MYFSKSRSTQILYLSKSRSTQILYGGPFSIRLLMLTSDATNFNLTDFRNGSAAITALRTFDRLAILMIDSGSPPMSSTSTLTVVIGDRNDHPHSSAVLGKSSFLPLPVENQRCTGDISAAPETSALHRRHR
ncbi:hypothetical protein NQZ68_020156 [Dissostichus eleginoides]|nr:hypothetical protein NQZ68_020156 [Dissostichus eleginoides]